MTKTTAKPPTERDRQLKKRQWLALYLPIMVSVALGLTAVTLVAVLGLKAGNLGGDPASAWGDAAAVLVVLQVAMLGLVLLVLLVSLCALFFWLYGKTRPVLHGGQDFALVVSQRVEKPAGRLVGLLARPYSLGARVRTLTQWLRR
jgi:hypothetical protein